METEEKTPQSYTPTAEPSKEESAQPKEIDDLRNQLTETSRLYKSTKTELQKSIEEAKSHQRNVSKIDRLEKRLEDFSTKFEVQTAMLADLVDRTSGEEEETPKGRRSEQYLSQIKQRDETTQKERQAEQRRVFEQSAFEADNLAKTAGLEMDKSPELTTAYMWFRMGDAERGLAEVKRVTGSKQAEVKKDPQVDEEEIERRAEAKARKQLEEKGLLFTDTGGPSASGGSFQDVEQKYIQGKISDEEYSDARRKAGKF